MAIGKAPVWGFPSMVKYDADARVSLDKSTTEVGGDRCIEALSLCFGNAFEIKVREPFGVEAQMYIGHCCFPFLPGSFS